MKRMSALLFLVVAAVAAPAFALQKSNQVAVGSATGHASVSAALAALRANPDVRITSQHGWILASDDRTRTLWSFVPRDDPAYPAVVKRVISQRHGSVLIRMSVDCGAGPSACAHLVARFRALNERMRARMQGGAGRSSRVVR